jgi:long-chain acyl-CoA synthetase
VKNKVHADEKIWFKNWPIDVPKNLSYPEVSLFELLRQSARDHPAQIAISYLGNDISYQELDSLSDQFASSLSEILGVKKGDRVALFLPNIPQFVIAYYGVLKAGAVLTVLSPMHREREVLHQLNDSEAKTIVTLDSLASLVQAIWEKTNLKNIIVTTLEENANLPILAEFLAKGLNVHSFQKLLYERTPPSSNLKINPHDDIAVLQYTGGTTSDPKAAMLTHINLVSNSVAFASWIKGRLTDETFLTALPLFHIYGMTTSMNAPIVLASKMILLPKFEPLKILEIIQKDKVTVFCGVPIMYQSLLACPKLDNYDLSSIRVCISGGSPLPPQIQRKFMQISGGLLAEGYGLSEASPVTHCNPVDKTIKTVRVGSIGLPLPGTDAKIVDRDTGTRNLPVGEDGELAVRGPQIMKGYWRHPDATALVLRNGWLLTGDIARMDAEGYFFITDRKKDLIKSKDYSVYPKEIEEVLYDHPAVRLCAVIGKPDRVAGEIPKAFVVLKDGANATENEIIDFVKERIASYKSIREVEFRKELPISSAGKPLRRMLREEESKAAH